jgi:hypothetical protein
MRIRLRKFFLAKVGQPVNEANARFFSSKGSRLRQLLKSALLTKRVIRSRNKEYQQPIPVSTASSYVPDYVLIETLAGCRYS